MGEGNSLQLKFARWDTGDIAVCARLFVEVFTAEPWREPWTEATASARLREVDDTPGALGVVCRGRAALAFAAGYAESSYSGKVFYLKEMCVHRAWQRRGVGGQLLDFLQAELAKEHVRHVYLLTRAESPAAAFYAGSGFVTSRRTQLMSKNM